MSLHDAVSGGSERDVVSWLERHEEEDINLRDGSGNTPLIWAVLCIEDEEKCRKVIELLLERNADTKAVNNIGYSVLLASVYHHKPLLVATLLSHGAWITLSTPYNELHLAAEKGFNDIISIFTTDRRFTPECTNIPDRHQETPFFKACLNGHKKCARALIEAGGDLGGKGVIEVMFEHIGYPEKLILDLLDFGINQVVNKKNHNKCDYDINFSVLAPRNCTRQMDVLSNIIEVATEEEITEIFQHPLIELYLTLKWSRIRQFFYLWIVIYVAFVFSLWVYITVLLHGDRDYKTMAQLNRVLLVGTGSGLLGHAILQAILSYRVSYQKREIWINITCTSLSIIVASIQGTPHESKNVPDWIFHAISVAVLLAWIELMLLIGRLPTYGYYSLMFAVVLHNVIKVLLAFLCLLIGFSLSFSVQFRGYEQFKDPWRALVKTTVMMMGEFEYADLFAEESPTRLPATSRVIFIMFIILSSIVLMNLMVGLAVSDIQGLQKESHARKLEKQIDFLTQLEKVITCKYFTDSTVLPVPIKRFLHRRSFIDVRFQVATSKEFRRSRGLPHRLVDSIISIGKRRHQDEKDKLSS